MSEVDFCLKWMTLGAHQKGWLLAWKHLRTLMFFRNNPKDAVEESHYPIHFWFPLLLSFQGVACRSSPWWGAAYVWSAPSTVEFAFETSVKARVELDVLTAGNLDFQGSCCHLREDHNPTQKRCEVFLESMGCCQRKSKGSDWSILFLRLLRLPPMHMEIRNNTIWLEWACNRPWFQTPWHVQDSSEEGALYNTIYI